MMRFKDSSIGLQNLCPQLILALIIIEGVFITHGVDLVITSLNDAKHGETSLHYDGKGADIRSRTVQNKQKLLADCKEALGNNPDFDFVLESDHFHLEFQPKRRPYHV